MAENQTTAKMELQKSKLTNNNKLPAEKTTTKQLSKEVQTKPIIVSKNEKVSKSFCSQGITEKKFSSSASKRFSS